MSKTPEDWVTVCGKLHANLMANKSAAPFLEKVDWKAWGLDTYPLIIKKPMDLGLVKQKLERGEYKSANEYAADVHLVFDNCMTFNAEGSEYYKKAEKLKKLFEEKFSKALNTSGEAVAEDARVPMLADKRAFSQSVHNIESEDLGQVVQLLDSRCPAAIRKLEGTSDDIEIDIDAIDPATFWELDRLVKDCLARSRGKKKRTEEAGGKVKKQRT